MRFVIDGGHFEDLDGFYAEVSKELLDGAYWGRNLDAFDDILYGDMGQVPGGDIEITFVWRNSARSRRDLGAAETARWLRAGLDRIHPSGRSEWERRLAAAERQEGETLFDTLVEIIRSHQNIVLLLE